VRRDAGVLLPCTVGGTSGGLTRLDFDGGVLLTTPQDAPPGARLRVRLRARDITIAIEEPRGLSTRNILPARLAGIDPIEGTAEAFARLEVGPSVMLARITRDSVQRLALRPGMPVWALVKAVTFDHRAVAGGHAPLGPIGDDP